MSDLIDPRMEPQTSRTDSDVLTTDLPGVLFTRKSKLLPFSTVKWFLHANRMNCLCASIWIATIDLIKRINILFYHDKAAILEIVIILTI